MINEHLKIWVEFLIPHFCIYASLQDLCIITVFELLRYLSF